MNIRHAEHLYMECGLMSGVNRHQIEFTDDVAMFFTDIERNTGLVDIELPSGVVVQGRPFQDRRWSGQHWKGVWRLNLPTIKMGGQQYPNEVILLTRRQGGGYLLEVATPGTATARQWQTNAVQTGQMGVTGQITHPGREYGYW